MPSFLPSAINHLEGRLIIRMPVESDDRSSDSDPK